MAAAERPQLIPSSKFNLPLSLFVFVYFALVSLRRGEDGYIRSLARDESERVNERRLGTGRRLLANANFNLIIPLALLCFLVHISRRSKERDCCGSL